MTYKEAERDIKRYGGRAVPSNMNNTWYCQRKGYISLDYQGNELMRYYPDGSVLLKFRGASRWASDRNLKSYSIWSERHRMNYYNPFRLKWFIYAYRFHTMIVKGTANNPERHGGREVPIELKINADGSINEFELGKTFNSLQRKYKLIDYKNDKPRVRARYWAARVRNLFLNRKGCQAGGNRRKGCSRGWDWNGSNTPQRWHCGCFTYRKNLKFRYSRDRILREANATVRMHMIRLYGVERFFKEVKPVKVDVKDKYELLRFNTSGKSINANSPAAREEVLTALKMVCPSTGLTYVSLVPFGTNSVERALNWMYNVPDYFRMVGKES